MQILFIDESGTPPPQNKISNTPLFVLGGIVISEETWHKIAKDLDVIKNKYGIEGEIKWRNFAPFREGSKPHSLSHLSGEQKEALRTELYSAITKYKSIKLICVICDVEQAYQLPYVENADDLYWYAYKQLTERFQYFLQDTQREFGQKVNGIIVCDHRGPRDDERLRELHHKLLNGSNGHSSNYENLIEGLFIAPSHFSVGIQFADMVAGAIIRKEKDNDIRFFSQIQQSFRKSDTGKIEGYGLVYFPKRKTAPC